MSATNETRRSFLRLGGGALVAAWALRPGVALAQAAAKKEAESEPTSEKVLPAEDLMREHGVLSRILLIYDNARMKLSAGQEFPPEILSGATDIVQRFIEQYHEMNEEAYLFPRFEKKGGELADLVKVLLKQHEAGREITALMMRGASAEALKSAAAKNQMVEYLGRFTRMYRPHKAREDTILFPAIRSVMTAKEYEELGDKFEDIEHKRFGEEGYEKVVDQVAEFEKKLNLYDLTNFTPKTEP